MHRDRWSDEQLSEAAADICSYHRTAAVKQRLPSMADTARFRRFPRAR